MVGDVAGLVLVDLGDVSGVAAEVCVEVGTVDVGIVEIRIVQVVHGGLVHGGLVRICVLCRVVIVPAAVGIGVVVVGIVGGVAVVVGVFEAIWLVIGLFRIGVTAVLVVILVVVLVVAHRDGQVGQAPLVGSARVRVRGRLPGRVPVTALDQLHSVGIGIGICICIGNDIGAGSGGSRGSGGRYRPGDGIGP